MKGQFFRAVLSGNFRKLDSLNIGDVRAIQPRRYMIRQNFFCKAKILLIKFKFCAKTSEE